MESRLPSDLHRPSAAIIEQELKRGTLPGSTSRQVASPFAAITRWQVEDASHDESAIMRARHVLVGLAATLTYSHVLHPHNFNARAGSRVMSTIRDSEGLPFSTRHELGHRDWQTAVWWLPDGIDRGLAAIKRALGVPPGQLDRFFDVLTTRDGRLGHLRRVPADLRDAVEAFRDIAGDYGADKTLERWQIPLSEFSENITSKAFAIFPDDPAAQRAQQKWEAMSPEEQRRRLRLINAVEEMAADGYAMWAMNKRDAEQPLAQEVGRFLTGQIGTSWEDTAEQRSRVLQAVLSAPLHEDDVEWLRAERPELAYAHQELRGLALRPDGGAVSALSDRTQRALANGGLDALRDYDVKDIGGHGPVLFNPHRHYTMTSLTTPVPPEMRQALLPHVDGPTDEIFWDIDITPAQIVGYRMYRGGRPVRGQFHLRLESPRSNATELAPDSKWGLASSLLDDAVGSPMPPRYTKELATRIPNSGHFRVTASDLLAFADELGFSADAGRHVAGTHLAVELHSTNQGLQCEVLLRGGEHNRSLGRIPLAGTHSTPNGNPVTVGDGARLPDHIERAIKDASVALLYSDELDDNTRDILRQAADDINAVGRFEQAVWLEDFDYLISLYDVQKDATQELGQPAPLRPAIDDHAVEQARRAIARHELRFHWAAGLSAVDAGIDIRQLIGRLANITDLPPTEDQALLSAAQQVLDAAVADPAQHALRQRLRDELDRDPRSCALVTTPATRRLLDDEQSRRSDKKLVKQDRKSGVAMSPHATGATSSGGIRSLLMATDNQSAITNDEPDQTVRPPRTSSAPVCQRPTPGADGPGIPPPTRPYGMR